MADDDSPPLAERRKRGQNTFQTSFGRVSVDAWVPVKDEGEDAKTTDGDASYVDQQYFGKAVRAARREGRGEEAASSGADFIDEQYFGKSPDALPTRFPLEEELPVPTMPTRSKEKTQGRAVQRRDDETPTEAKSESDPTDSRRSESVLAYKELRTNFDWMTEDELLELLRGRVLLNRDGVVALDKPAGLPVHGGPKVHLHLVRMLPRLASLLGADRLYLAHRLDQETSGVLLLARDEMTASRLHDAFQKRAVLKQYLAVTSRVPKMPDGEITFGLKEGKVGGNAFKMVPSTEKEAISRFRVMASNNCAALVQVQPVTGLRHQVRAHLAYGLGCPILGDHKYSHNDRLAPQKLSGETLQKLRLRQTQVRNIPLHLHADQVVLPQWTSNGQLAVGAPLPKLFRQTLKWLKLRVK